jgi:hypothetical protein
VRSLGEAATGEKYIEETDSQPAQWCSRMFDLNIVVDTKGGYYVEDKDDNQSKLQDWLASLVVHMEVFACLSPRQFWLRSFSMILDY